MKSILLILITLFSIKSYSATMLSVGTYVPHAFTAQEDWDGGKQAFEINPAFSIGTQMPFLGQFFTPELGFVYHRDTYDNSEQSTIFILYNMTMRLTNTTMLRYGLGTFWERYSGDGSTVVLNNGGSTQSFYAPDSTTTSYHTDLILGAEQFIKASMSLRFDLTFTGWVSQLFEHKNYLLTLNLYGVL